MASSVLLVALALFAAASAAPEQRLVGGTPTDIADFPYAVSLVYTYRPGITVQRCVGGLISSYHVLTTGFCFHEATLSSFLVRAGSTNSMSGGTTVSINNYAIHPDYTASPLSNDLAVATVASALGLSGNINVLYLPPQGFNIADNTALRVASWGFDETNSQLQFLKTIFLNKVNIATCSSAYADKDNAPTISEIGVICANAPGRGTCRGDSGAPMALGQTVVGISSAFYECGNDDVPDVFTRVDSYTNWILSVATPPSREGVPVRIAPVH